MMTDNYRHYTDRSDWPDKVRRLVGDPRADPTDFFRDPRLR